MQGSIFQVRVQGTLLPKPCDFVGPLYVVVAWHADLCCSTGPTRALVSSSRPNMRGRWIFGTTTRSPFKGLTPSDTLCCTSMAAYTSTWTPHATGPSLSTKSNRTTRSTMPCSNRQHRQAYPTISSSRPPATPSLPRHSLGYGSTTTSPPCGLTSSPTPPS